MITSSYHVIVVSSDGLLYSKVYRQEVLQTFIGTRQFYNILLNSTLLLQRNTFKDNNILLLFN